MKMNNNSPRKREENVTETKTDKLRIFVNFWSDFGRLLGAFFDPKTIKNSVAILAGIFTA